MPEFTIVICGRVGGGKVVPVPGARVSECSSCGAAIWVGPTSEPAVKSGAKLECSECAVPKLRAAQAAGKLKVGALSDQSPLEVAVVTAEMLRGK